MKEREVPMDGEKKFVLMIVAIVVLCLTVVYGFLFVSLWPYREWVGVSLLGLVVLLVLVFIRGKLNEQALRQVRYRHHEETPLDAYGEPHYWHTGTQINPHRVPSTCSYEHGQYE